MRANLLPPNSHLVPISKFRTIKDKIDKLKMIIIVNNNKFMAVCLSIERYNELIEIEEIYKREHLYDDILNNTHKSKCRFPEGLGGDY